MFTDRDKKKALAIVHIFETSKPLGDYSAVAVLDDGAGVSYGINQFTHRSGSLYAVVNTFLGEGGQSGVIESRLPLLKSKSKASIEKLASDKAFKDALRDVAYTPAMRLAQDQIMENMYLLPAIEACEGSKFRRAMSLAVVYDSINHGSYAKIRDRVKINPDGMDPDEFEKAWITRYVSRRDQWLEAFPRLAKTDYRTDFFLDQIRRGNWDLNLPLDVHGYKLTEARLFPKTAAASTMPDPVSSNSPSGQDNGSSIGPQTPGGSQAGGPVPPPSGDSVVIERGTVEEPPGFFKGLWKKITAALASVGGADQATSYAQSAQAFGLPPEFWTKVFYAVAAIVAVWIGYEVWRHFWKPVAQRRRTDKLIGANTTPGNVVMVVCPEDLAEYEAAGWTVVRRR